MTRRTPPPCPWTLHRRCECLKAFERIKAQLADFGKYLVMEDQEEAVRLGEEETDDCIATLFVHLHCCAQNHPLEVYRKMAKKDLELRFFDEIKAQQVRFQ